MNINKRTRFCSDSIRLLNEPKKIVQIYLFNLTNEHKRTLIKLIHEQFIEHSITLYSYPKAVLIKENQILEIVWLIKPIRVNHQNQILEIVWLIKPIRVNHHSCNCGSAAFISLRYDITL